MITRRRRKPPRRDAADATITTTPGGDSASVSRIQPWSGNIGSRVAAATIITRLTPSWTRGVSVDFRSASMSKLWAPNAAYRANVPTARAAAPRPQ